MANDALSPRALKASDTLWYVAGGQGASMVGLRLILSGPNVPDCVSHDSQILSGGALAARNRETVRTYATDAGQRITKTIWLPGEFAEDVTAQVDVAGQRASMQLKARRECKSTSECTCFLFESCSCRADAGACPCLEGISPDAVAPWRALQDCRNDGGGDLGCEAQLRRCREHAL